MKLLLVFGVQNQTQKGSEIKELSNTQEIFGNETKPVWIFLIKDNYVLSSHPTERYPQNVAVFIHLFIYTPDYVTSSLLPKFFSSSQHD